MGGKEQVGGESGGGGSKIEMGDLGCDIGLRKRGMQHGD